MTEVENFIFGLEGDQREIMLYFHHLLVDKMNLHCKMRFKIPFYDGKSWICYLSPLKDGRVELVFTRGRELSNEQGLLQARERKQVAGMLFGKLSEIPEETVREVIHEAILLDEIKPYESKRKTAKAGDQKK
jgi:hypothetical protein